jgi:IS1 family transposase
MNKLATDKRAQILSLLAEGNSMRATSRLTGVSINTVTKLLIDAGRACSRYQDEVFRNLKCSRLQCDEIWAFCYAKEKNCTAEMKQAGAGDVWTWAAIDADTKLIPCWYVGGRDAGAAHHFIHDLKERLASRTQITTDGHRVYVNAIADAFGGEVDYAMLVKIYGVATTGPARYSPAQCMGARKAVISGKPDFKHVSTSFSERANLTMRMGMRRFTRLTNGFSKKVENHEHSVALHFMHYNFCRIHKTLRVTPAMEAGVADHVWEMTDVVAMIDRHAANSVAGGTNSAVG